MKTKFDYTFKGVSLDVDVPMDMEGNRVQARVGITGDVEVHVTTEGNWIDSIFSILAFNKIVKVLQQLCK